MTLFNANWHFASLAPRAGAALACLLLAGCATTPVPIAVVSDSYCTASRKITWAIADTSETIHQVEMHNRSIDRACSRKSKSKPVS